MFRLCHNLVLLSFYIYKCDNDGSKIILPKLPQSPIKNLSIIATLHLIRRKYFLLISSHHILNIPGWVMDFFAPALYNFTMHSNFVLSQKNRQFFIALVVCLRFEFQFLFTLNSSLIKRYLLGASGERRRYFIIQTKESSFQFLSIEDCCWIVKENKLQLCFSFLLCLLFYVSFFPSSRIFHVETSDDIELPKFTFGVIRLLCEVKVDV